MINAATIFPRGVARDIDLSTGRQRSRGFTIAISCGASIRLCEVIRSIVDWAHISGARRMGLRAESPFVTMTIAICITAYISM